MYIRRKAFSNVLSFLTVKWPRKMALLALRGHPQPLKKPSQSQKGHFYEKMNALNDTKTAELSKSAEGNGEYLWSSVAFVEAWIKSNFPNGTTSLKTTQMLHKNKAWPSQGLGRQVSHELVVVVFVRETPVAVHRRLGAVHVISLSKRRLFSRVSEDVSGFFQQRRPAFDSSAKVCFCFDVSAVAR